MDPKYLTGTSEDHFGLRVMYERAESVGGKFCIYNRVEAGTCVSVEFPSKKKDED